MRFAADRRAFPWLVAAGFLVLALHGLGASDVVGDDEAREAGIVEDVVAGHWLWPRFDAELIPDKPVLYHWVAALPVAAAGFSATAARLPAALAAAALVGWTAWFGARVLAPDAGLAAGVLLATFPALFERARLARPDTLMLALLAPALGLAFTCWRTRRRRDATWALVLLGAATLAKGPVAPALFATTLVGFLAWQRELRRLRSFVTWPGVAAFVVLGLGWYAVALAGWGDEFVRQHLVGRYLRNLAGGLVRGESYSERSLLYHATFYPLHLPLLALPWTPLVVAAAVRTWRRPRRAPAPLARFLACWALAPVVVFTPAEYKLRYYLLPSLPALALLAAPLAAELIARQPGRLRASRASVAWAAGVLVGGGGAAALVLTHPALLARSDQAALAALLDTLPGGTAGAAAAVGLGLGVLGAAIALRAWGPLAALTAVATLGWLAVGVPGVDARTSAHASLRGFAEVVRSRFPPGHDVAFYADPVRAVVVYVGRDVPSLGHDASRITPGLGVIATLPAYQVLADAGYVGESLAMGDGRIGNLEQGTLVLAQGLERGR